MLNVGVCISGGGTNLQAIMDAIRDGKIRNARISVVVSSKAGVYGLVRAAGAGIPTVCISPKAYGTSEAFAEALISCMEEYRVDLIVLAGFLAAVPPQVIARYRDRIINIHPSLIPSFCGKGFYGLKVHEAALNKGVKVTGATVHMVDEGMDTGKILFQKAVEVKENDTPETLQRRVMEEAEWILLPKAVDMFAGRENIDK